MHSVTLTKKSVYPVPKARIQKFNQHSRNPWPFFSLFTSQRGAKKKKGQVCVSMLHNAGMPAGARTVIDLPAALAYTSPRESVWLARARARAGLDANCASGTEPACRFRAARSTEALVSAIIVASAARRPSHLRLPRL